MNHLTQEEIDGLSDGSLNPEHRARVETHVAACARCARELRLQQNLGKAIAQLPLEKTSVEFTGRLMERILSSQKATVWSRLLLHAGNVFAMMLVLGVIGYVLTTPKLFVKSEQPSAVTKAFKPFQQFYSDARSFLTSRSEQLNQGVLGTSSPHAFRLLTFALITLVVLGAFDRYVIRRIMHLKL